MHGGGIGQDGALHEPNCLCGAIDAKRKFVDSAVHKKRLSSRVRSSIKAPRIEINSMQDTSYVEQAQEGKSALLKAANSCSPFIC